jgi:phosphatidylethanolamine/phosphatidyl-N-methylethanolamine N-methyltransferase
VGALGERRAQTTLDDATAFLRAWLAAPLRVAALAPSGTALARLITRGISAEHAPVIELGAGTGAFTRALLARGVPEDALVLVEADANLARLLRARFPRAQVLQLDAARLRHIDVLGATRAGCVVSGLPLLSMSPRKIVAVLGGAFAHLPAGAAFYQFTYGLGCPVPQRILQRLELSAVRVGRTLANLPPASVFRIERA